jgi:hypothetical protein
VLGLMLRERWGAAEARTSRPERRRARCMVPAVRQPVGVSTGRRVHWTGGRPAPGYLGSARASPPAGLPAHTGPSLELDRFCTALLLREIGLKLIRPVATRQKGHQCLQSKVVKGVQTNFNHPHKQTNKVMLQLNKSV